MPITDEQKQKVQSQLMEWLAVDDDQEAEGLIDNHLDGWTEIERAYWHYIVDNYEPDEFIQAVEEQRI